MSPAAFALKLSSPLRTEAEIGNSLAIVHDDTDC